MQAIHPHTGRAYVVGMTGPPGAGKSTLVDELIRAIRSAGQTVGVIAVDPNSPYSGGAILGDRIRMMRHASDDGVFIRSMGARGHLGGLALAARNAIAVLDATGRDVIVVETVGVGQSELEIADASDTTVVVIPPGLGDGVQAIKAGIMEIADIFVVNKADQPRAERVVADIRDLLRMELAPREWNPPIVRAVATENQGLEHLWMRVQQHEQYLRKSGEFQPRRRARISRHIMDIAERKVHEEVLNPLTASKEFQDMLDLVVDRRIDPYTAAKRVTPTLRTRMEGRESAC
jgi:LAO/AO transport system kinase